MSYSWSLVQSDLSGSWSGITSKSHLIWACNRNGGSSTNFIYYSPNGGNTWYTVSSPTTFTNARYPFAIAANSAGTTVIIQSYYGSFVYSSGTWSSVNSLTNTGLVIRGAAYITDVGDYAVVGTRGGAQLAQIILTSSNFIINSVSDTNNYTATTNSIVGNSDGSILFFGIDTGIAIATGNNLSAGTVTVSSVLSLSAGTRVNAIACDSSGQYIVAVVYNGYYYSSNFGTNWSSIQTFSGTGYSTSYTNSVCCITSNGSSSSFAITVGHDNAILLSSNAGATFTTVYTSSTNLSGYAGLFGINIGSNGTGIVATAYDTSGSGFVVGYPPSPSSPTICFKEGSKILCLIDEQEMYVPIETIKPGMLVKTRLDGYKPVALIGTSKLYNSGDDLRSTRRLYKLTQEKYPEITEDLILTGCHCILTETISDEERAGIVDVMKNVYVTDRKYRLPACVDERAIPYRVEGVFPIWHLALEHEDMYMNYGIYANGLLVESTSKRMISQYSGMKLIEN